MYLTQSEPCLLPLTSDVSRWLIEVIPFKAAAQLSNHFPSMRGYKLFGRGFLNVEHLEREAAP